jgi:hypothetical protein
VLDASVLSAIARPAAAEGGAVHVVIAGAVFSVYVVAGLLMLWLMTETSSATADAVLVRFSSSLFLSAGFIGASGLVGKAEDQVRGKTEEVAAVTGWTLVLGLLITAAGVATILTWLPEKWFRRDIPDTLSVAGIFLPGLMTLAPGPLGVGVLWVLKVLALPGGLLAWGLGI